MNKGKIILSIISVLVCLWHADLSAQPILSGASSSGFTAENSSQAAMTFNANPMSQDDESIITVDFCSSLPSDPGLISVKIKKGSGSFVTIPSGTDISSISDHTIHYTLTNTGSPSPSPPPACPMSGALQLEILIVHEHTGPAAETWHLRLENMGVTSKYIVSATDNASFTNIHLLPTVMTTPNTYTREERSSAVTIGGGGGSNIWPATPTTLSYQWTQDSGPVIGFPSMTTGTLQVLPPPAAELPSVSIETSYVFTLQVTDTPVDATFAQHGPMVNLDTVTLDTTPLEGKDIMLILDHSGSMLSENKWEITRQAGSLFIDLLRALKNDDSGTLNSSEKSKIGHMKFESTSCGWGGAAPESAGDLHVGLNLTSLDSLGIFQPVDSAYDSTPWGCTPIGDALNLAKNKFNSGGTPGRSNPIFVLMTDGMENSGNLKISDVRSSVGSWPALLRDATFFTLGVGNINVEESELQNLAALTGSHEGVYRKATDLTDQQVQEFFIEILGDVIKAQQIMAEPGGSASEKSFQVNSGETRIAFVLLWDRTVAGPYYPRLALSGTWADTIHWNNASGFSNVRVSHQVAGADGYSFMVVDYKNENKVNGLWQVDFADINGNKAIVPAGAHPRIIAIVDPHLFADFYFDSAIHKTGDPIVLKTAIKEGGKPVTGADVRVQLVQPMEGEGTFLALNSAKYQSMISSRKIKGDQTPKKAMLANLLSQLGKDSLDTGNKGIQLFDDGVHNDGLPNDGVYGNIFSDTFKEGTYTFQYKASGRTSSNDNFTRTETKCNYVGVNVDQSSSDTFSQILSPSGGLNMMEFFIIPKDAKGEYLGPFRASEIAFEVASGTPVGDVKDHQNGKYSQVVAYAPGAPLMVVPSVSGIQFPPMGTGQGGRNLGFVHWFIVLLLVIIFILVILIYRCACRGRK